MSFGLGDTEQRLRAGPPWRSFSPQRVHARQEGVWARVSCFGLREVPAYWRLVRGLGQGLGVGGLLLQGCLKARQFLKHIYRAPLCAALSFFLSFFSKTKLCASRFSNIKHIGFSAILVSIHTIFLAQMEERTRRVPVDSTHFQESTLGARNDPALLYEGGSSSTATLGLNLGFVR